MLGFTAVFLVYLLHAVAGHQQLFIGFLWLQHSVLGLARSLSITFGAGLPYALLVWWVRPHFFNRPRRGGQPYAAARQIFDAPGPPCYDYLNLLQLGTLYRALRPLWSSLYFSLLAVALLLRPCWLLADFALSPILLAAVPPALRAAEAEDANDHILLRTCECGREFV